MLDRWEAEQLLFPRRPSHRLPLRYFRQTEVMPATLADSHLTVYQVVSEMRQEERRQDQEQDQPLAVQEPPVSLGFEYYPTEVLR